MLVASARGRRIPVILAAAVLAAALGITGAALASPGRYLDLDEFLTAALGVEPPAPEVIFIDAELRTHLESALGHRLSLLRIRYWRDQETTAWVLDEIGKTEPITIGVTVENGFIRNVRVLEFRESRGWEIRFPFFTDQFKGAGLDRNRHIDRSIDGITGATLSVRAVDKVVRAALILDERVRKEKKASS